VNTQEQFAIHARGLTKAYQIYTRPQDRLFQMIWGGRKTFYQDFLAVRHVDVDVRRGETFGIVGRNGSGKSTLLKLICATLSPTAGDVKVNGHIAPLLTIGAGFNPDFTGRENVFLNSSILGLTDEAINDHLDAIIDFADIGEFFDQPIKNYSSGMYARLAFAVAINTNPDILAIDEVLAVGDEAFTRKCFARIAEIKANGATILLVSHSADTIIEFCDRALLMERGERLLTSDPKTIISRYHRLLYSPPEELPAVLQEIRNLDKGQVSESVSTGTAASTHESKGVETNEDFGYFDPNLKPQSTVEYVPKGAQIRGACILDPKGRQVNVLRPGKIYIYTYEVEFMKPAFRVQFGMMVKLVTGFELAGQVSHPTGSGIESIDRGTTVCVRFPFKTALVPGVYFLNAGVRGICDGEEEFLHRILDIIMFRVLPAPECRTKGYIDLAPSNESAIEVDPRPTVSSVIKAMDSQPKCDPRSSFDPCET